MTNNEDLDLISSPSALSEAQFYLRLSGTRNLKEFRQWWDKAFSEAPCPQINLAFCKQTDCIFFWNDEEKRSRNGLG